MRGHSTGPLGESVFSGQRCRSKSPGVAGLIPIFPSLRAGLSRCVREAAEGTERRSGTGMGSLSTHTKPHVGLMLEMLHNFIQYRFAGNRPGYERHRLRMGGNDRGYDDSQKRDAGNSGRLPPTCSADLFFIQT